MAARQIFIDTSGFKALLDEGDDFHVPALKFWQGLHQEDVFLITSNYILDEAFTLIRVRTGLAKAMKLRELLVESAHFFQINRVQIDDEALAWRWFVQPWSGLSFTDCVSFAQMERLEIGEVFTFDNHFRRAGFAVLPD